MASLPHSTDARAAAVSAEPPDRTAQAVLAGLGVGLRRALRTPSRWLPLALALTLAAAFLGVVLAGAVVAGDRAAHRALAGRGHGDAAVSLSWNGGAGAKVDRQARAALQGAGTGRVHRGLLMVPATFDRALIRMAAAEPVRDSVRLLSGRLPSGVCRPARCEVLRIAGPALPLQLLDRGTRFVITGTASLVDPTLFSLTTRPADLRASAAANRPTLLLAADPAGADALPALATVSRTQTWTGGIPLARLHAWQLGAALDRLGRLRQRVDSQTDSFTFSGPEALLASVKARVDAAPGRLRGAASAGLAALIAFLALAALPLRLGVLAESGRLARAGAFASQRALAIAGEAAVPVVVGFVVGLGVAIIAALARAAAAAEPVGHVLAAVGAPLARDVALVGLVALVTVAAVTSFSGRVLRALAAGALIAVAAALVAVLVSSNDAGALPIAVVPLAAALAALTTGLALPALFRLLARTALARRPRAGLAVVQLAREPAAASVVAAALAAAVGIAGFSLAYRDTVRASQAAQATQRVPLDAVIAAGPSLAPPLRNVPLRDWRRASHAEVLPVLHDAGRAFAGPSELDAAVVGVPAAAVPRVDAAPGVVAQALAVRDAFAGPRIPVDARTITMTARAEHDQIDLTLYLRDRDGYATTPVDLGTVTSTARRLHIAVPRRARGGTLDALVGSRTLGQEVTATHQLAEGGGGSAASTGTLVLDDLRLGTSSADFSGFTGRGGFARERAGGGSARGVRLRFSLDGSQTAVARPPRPADRAALPVLATPQLAAYARISGGLTVEVDGVKLRARVAGTLRRLPTVATGAPALLADARALASALDAAAPGTAEVTQLWVAGNPRAAEDLARHEGMAVQTHAAVLARLRAEPVGRELMSVTALTALLSVLLCAAGLVVATRTQLRDSSHALVDLEAQGVGPAAARSSLRARAVMVVATGVATGFVCALLLDREVARAALSAFATSPDPPIGREIPLPATIGVAVGVGALAVASAAAVLAGAFRERVPRPARGGELA